MVTRAENRPLARPRIPTSRMARVAFKSSPVLLLVPVLLLIAGFQGRGEQVPGLFLWTIASFSIGQAAALLGPIAGGTAAYLGGRVASGTTGVLLRSLSDRGVRIHVLVLTATAFWVLVAWSGYILYQIVLGLALAEWGFLDAMPVTVGMAVIGMSVCVGYALGVLFPGQYIPIFVGAGLAILFMAIYVIGNDKPELQWMGIYDSVPGAGSQKSLKYLSPMQIFSGSTSTPVATSWGTIGPRFIGWMLGLAAVSLGVLGLISGRRVIGVLVSMLGGALAVAGAASLLALPAEHSELPREEVTYENVCSGSPIEVCVHPAYRPNLDPTIRIANEVLGPIAGLSGVPDRIEQFGTGPRGDRVFEIYFENGSVETLATNYLGVIRDYSQGQVSPGQSVIGYWLFTRVVDDADGYYLGMWLPEPRFFPQDLEGPPTAFLREKVERWDALPTDEQRSWLEANWTALINGEIDWDDLP